jgi:hypothetical protein
MKICVVVPNEQYLSQAGPRIRYSRIQASLQQGGHSLTLLPAEKCKQINHDVYVLSKCFDPQSLVLAQIAAAKGKVVGIDLFDDYFSEAQDSRFQRLRGWLKYCLQYADFVMCSTPVMRRVAQQYARDLPAYVMNDPFEGYDLKILRRNLARKSSSLWANGVLNVAWYGMGDNPYFPVGLADLAAFSDQLANMQGKGFDIRLQILTNSRAMTGDSLAALSAIPIPYELHEWNEAKERELLEQTHVVFLPVSAQNFSIAKSLNRAVTALISGNQILSAGFPLYKPFSSFLYLDAGEIVRDLRADRPKIRAQTLKTLDLLLHAHADPTVEARGLASLFETILYNKSMETARFKSRRPRAAVIHGVESTSAAHKFAKQVDVLSISSPLSSLNLNFDIRFDWNETRTGLDLLVSETAYEMLSADVAAKALPHGKILDFEFRRLTQEDFPLLTCSGGALADFGFAIGKLVAYSSVISTIQNVMNELFPEISCVVSESWRLPWQDLSENARVPLGVY